MYSKSEKDKDLEKQNKIPELADQIIIVDENKLSGITEQIIDIAKLGQLEKIPVVLCANNDRFEAAKDKIPVVLRANNDGFEAANKDLNVQTQAQNKV